MTIDMHSHFLPPAMADALRARTQPPWIEGLAGGGERLHMPLGHLAFTEDFVDIKARRAFMAEMNVDRQLLSFPGLFGLDSLAVAESLPLLTLYNDAAAELCADHPGQFSGLAALPMADIDAAVAEYRRGRERLGLIGAILPVNGLASLAEAEKLRPIFAAAAEIGGHIFIHPGRRPDEVPANPETAPPNPFSDSMPARQPLAVQDRVAAAMVTLLFTDFLAPYPDIGIHVANLGGTLPMVIERMDHMAATRDTDGPLPSTQLGRVHVDCASLGPRALEIAVAVYGADRVVMGTDCPIFSTKWTLGAIRDARLTDQDRETILETNARGLLERVT